MRNRSYRVLLVDDERVIREGISRLIDWERLGLTYTGCAADGLSAYEQLPELRPDIIITDIKMPKMDGLELIKLTLQLRPDTKFIVLSGHGEFEFASKAMQYGVKHYLLKPCDETDITEVLRQVIAGLDGERNQADLYQHMEDQLAEALPKVKEQLLRDCLLNRSFFKYEMDHYKHMLHIHDEKIRLILFQLEAAFEFIELYALKNISEELMQERNIMLSTIVGDKFIILVEDMDVQDIIQLTSRIKYEFESRYKIDLTLSISDPCTFEELPKVYEDAQQYLKYRFYLGESSIITSDEVDLETSSSSLDTINMNYSSIVMAIKIGNAEDLKDELALFFERLREQRCEIHVAISFCIELITTIVRQTMPDKINENIAKIVPILQMKTLEDIHKYVFNVSHVITKENYEIYSKKNRMLVHSMVQQIHDHLGNEELSLQWLAKNFFFMNVDYLGKLFRKETGEKFSQYVTRVRIEWAKELMIHYAHAKVYEIAEQTGFGHDPQYFSNIFKKYTGFTPMEYKTMAKQELHS
ncbi:response regulator transcription factor [Paenibacillus thalictri]|uniref:Response regulator n=1 Tax=Paenibacillus thalictri TaxID=2527873 RepID=A0A4Q9DUI0_9BACL|nr:response regulator [Paenibacillus thalictri]TBL80647.1 response regulator [Paenibacillus thalictri]